MTELKGGALSQPDPLSATSRPPDSSTLPNYHPQSSVKTQEIETFITGGPAGSCKARAGTVRPQPSEGIAASHIVAVHLTEESATQRTVGIETKLQ